ncbi:MAG: glycosyltransferase family 39 protein [Planctomycetota bacterium]
MTDPLPNDSRRRPWFFALALLLSAVGYLGFAVHAAYELPATADENLYVQTARVALAAGHWDHPDMRFQGPFGLVFNQLFVGRDWTDEERQEVTPELLFRARLGMLGFGLVTLVGVAFWSRRLFGDPGGALAALAFGLHPLVIGYGALVNVDMAHAATTLLTAWFTTAFVLRGRWSDLVGVGVALGLAVGTKYLALALAPFVGALVLVGAWRRCERQHVAVTLAAGLGLVALTFASLHAVYLFRAGFAFDFQPVSPLFESLYALPGFRAFAGLLPSDFVAAVDRLVAMDGERSIFYLGRYRPNPKSYYLVAALLKTPPGVLIASAASLVVCVVGQPRLSREARGALCVLLVLVALPLLVLTFGSSFKVGVRYVLQFAPLVAVALGVLGLFADRLTATALAVLLVASNVPATLAWAPNEIAYLNVLARRDGLVAPYWFADSNLEWRQNLERGPRLLRERYGELDVLRGIDGPRFGRVAAYLPDLVQRDPRDATRAWHWLTPFTPVDVQDAAWWVFEVTPESYRAALEQCDDPRVPADFFSGLVAAKRFDEARAVLPEVEAPLRPLLEAVLEFAETGNANRIELAGRALAAGYPEWSLRVLANGEPTPASTWIVARALLTQLRFDEAIEVLTMSGFVAETPDLALTLAEVLVRRWRATEARALVGEHGVAMRARNAEWFDRVLAKLEHREAVLNLSLAR